MPQSKTLLSQLAVIIPLAPGEDSWCELLPDLTELPPETEIWLASSEAISLEGFNPESPWHKRDPKPKGGEPGR